MEISQETKKKILKFQQSEITEAKVYRRLAYWTKSVANKKILFRIADDEERHYSIWKKYTGEDVQPNTWAYLKFTFLGRLLGLTFAIKLMERGEKGAQATYGGMSEIPEAIQIMNEEHEHENQLIEMIDEEHLKYMGSVVLGLNDALVELTGVLAGLTLALQDSQLIALTGTVTGIAAAFSMAASEYLSTKSEETDNNPLKASFYTGIAYLGTVIILIMPFLLLDNIYQSLIFTFSGAVIIIATFNYYISIARGLSFTRRFVEMTAISLGVAAFSFGIGFLMRIFFKVEV